MSWIASDSDVKSSRLSLIHKELFGFLSPWPPLSLAPPFPQFLRFSETSLFGSVTRKLVLHLLCSVLFMTVPISCNDRKENNKGSSPHAHSSDSRGRFFSIRVLGYCKPPYVPLSLLPLKFQRMGRRGKNKNMGKFPHPLWELRDSFSFLCTRIGELLLASSLSVSVSTSCSNCVEFRLVVTIRGE